MTLLERPPSHAVKLLARAPLLLYRLQLGALLGRRFLVIVHRGRRTGTLYRTVVEVVRYDPERREAVVASGWGAEASWYRNLRAAPAAEVWLAGRRFAPQQRFLEPAERIAVLRTYRDDHPWATRALGPLLGLGATDEALADAAEHLPMVAFREPEPAAREPRYLSADQARRVYDRIGRVQDVQEVYEHRATRELLGHSDFEHAHSVLEVGFGTGAFARRLLERHLPADARYVGLELSPHMLGLARHRLARFGSRVELRLTSGSLLLQFPDDTFDRVVANYVLDLLSPDDARRLVAEAHRALGQGGRLCLSSLTNGTTPASRLLTRAWERLWRLSPQLVGGCRPIVLDDYVDEREWTISHRATVCSLGICSEVLVAEKRLSS